MTPFAAWMRKALEKALDRFEEGQEAPARLREQVIAFANANPKATRTQWSDFAATYAEECYASGYLRGVEHAEREPAEVGEATPEKLADAVSPGWRERPWQPGIALAGADSVVGDHRTDEEVMASQVEALKAKALKAKARML